MTSGPEQTGQVVAAGGTETRLFSAPAGKRVLCLSTRVQAPLGAGIEIGVGKELETTYGFAGSGSTNYKAYFTNNTAAPITFAWSPLFG